MPDLSRCIRLGTICLSLALGVGAAPAAIAQSPIAVVIKGEVEKSVADANGVTTTSFGPLNIVVPGERIRYTLTVTNSGATPIPNLRIVDPLPAEVAFESTKDVAGFQVSVDSGTTYGTLADLLVKRTDGSDRAATPDDITHVRWQLANPVVPGIPQSVAFFGRVR